MNARESLELTKDVLKLDYEKEVAVISSRIKEILRRDLRRRGLVIAISGGIDSSVSAALCVKAVGVNKVFGLLLPEQDSSSESMLKGKLIAEHLGIKYEVQNIAPTLEAVGCYKWRDDAVKHIFPEYTSEWKLKIAITGGQEGQFNHFKLVVQKPDGEILTNKLNLKEYLQIVAATNYKQRIRKTVEYFHADRLNYAVVGTPNRLEYDQGFFVKNGDGSADLKPIAHLYKTQVYALASYLNLPDEICNTIPTTDTYSLPQGQDEFYFALPYEQMDLALWCRNNDVSPQECASLIGVSDSQAEFIYKDIDSKRRTTSYQHAKAVLVEQVKEITV